jgi:hypothetical protein
VLRHDVGVVSMLQLLVFIAVQLAWLGAPVLAAQPQTCPQGYYCAQGTGLVGTKCPVGTFGATPGLFDVAQCTACTAGSYCDVQVGLL